MDELVITGNPQAGKRDIDRHISQLVGNMEFVGLRNPPVIRFCTLWPIRYLFIYHSSQDRAFVEVLTIHAYNRLLI